MLVDIRGKRVVRGGVYKFAFFKGGDIVSSEKFQGGYHNSRRQKSQILTPLPLINTERSLNSSLYSNPPSPYSMCNIDGTALTVLLNYDYSLRCQLMLQRNQSPAAPARPAQSKLQEKVQHLIKAASIGGCWSCILHLLELMPQPAQNRPSCRPKVSDQNRFLYSCRSQE